MKWDELQATRDNRLTGTAWGAQYAAFDRTDALAAMESNMLFQDNQTGTWKVWNLTALTQKWINGSAANNGVILWATNEDTEAHDLRFYSRENATKQPKLVVTWSNTSRKTGFIS